jgi:16S rRNA G966 N2-methylase RsmD
MMIENLAWVLPRPRKSNKYIGGFPLHFEKKLLNLLNIDPQIHKILHPFGGMAEYGIRVDICEEAKPEIVGDAHNLPLPDNTFDLVILDPPYNEDYAKRLYGTGKLKWKKYTAEAVRVCKEKGIVVVYHMLATPAIPNTVLVKRIFLETRVWHKLRCVHIHQKRSELWRGG